MAQVQTKRKRQQRRKRAKGGRMPVISVFTIIVMLSIVISCNSVSLYHKNQELAERERQLEEKIEQEQQREEELKEYKKYVQTKKFAEEVAKDKLGLVYEDEIIFKPDEE